MTFTLIDALGLALGLAGVALAIYRGLHRGTYPGTSLTLVAASLGLAVILRTPGIGDVYLDDLGYTLTGGYNLPDLLGHLASFAAITSGIIYLCSALLDPLAARRVERIVIAVMSLFAAACVATFISGRGYDTQTTDVVHLSGMAPYASLFAACLLTWHAVTLYVAWQLADTVGRNCLCTTLTVAGFFGALMALHRLAVVVWPELAQNHYDAVAWGLSLVTIAGYLAAAILATRFRRADHGRVSDSSAVA